MVNARLDDVAQRLSEVRQAIQAAMVGAEVDPELAAAAQTLESELKKLEMVTGELAGTAGAALLLAAGTYCRACGTAFPGRLEGGDCPNCGTLGRLLPLHDGAEAARLARWSPRFTVDAADPAQPATANSALVPAVLPG